MFDPDFKAFCVEIIMALTAVRDALAFEVLVADWTGVVVVWRWEIVLGLGVVVIVWDLLLFSGDVFVCDCRFLLFLAVFALDQPLQLTIQIGG